MRPNRAHHTGVALLLPAALALLAGWEVPLDRAADAGASEPVPLVTGRFVTPLGRHAQVGSFPCNLLLNPEGTHLVSTNTGARQFLSALQVSDGRRVSQVGFNELRRDGSGKREGLYYGLAWGPARGEARTVYVSRGAEDRISIFELERGMLRDTGRSLSDPSPTPGFKLPRHVAGLAVSSEGSRLYAVYNNTSVWSKHQGALGVLDTATGAVRARVPLPGFPFAAAAITRGPHRDRKVYVSSERDGVVAVVNPQTAAAPTTISTGTQPTALLLDREQHRLFVANSGSDTISVIDTETDRVARTVLLRPHDARDLPGATPTGVALSPDERRLYVTLAEMNAVAVVELPEGRLRGYLPTGWYPTAAAVSPDGTRLFVASAKGVVARVPNGANLDLRGLPYARSVPTGNTPRYIQNGLEGVVATIELSAALRGLDRLTRRVLENNRLSGAARRRGSRFRNPGIEHVIYIIKENRTYDQVLGDLPQGNGSSALCLFPRPVSPNHHALAERFVLLDNFYDCAEVSADGWNWSTAGMISEHSARNVPYQYSNRGREYDFEGQNNGIAVDLEGIPDVNRPPSGYLWDLAARHSISFRNYGFFTSFDAGTERRPDGTPLAKVNQPTQKALVGKTDEEFLRFDMRYPDSEAGIRHGSVAPVQLRAYGRYGAPSRFSEWKREFDEFVRTRTLPRLTMLRLPRDHTQGTSPGYHSPRAMVADNDYALGQVVDALSRSPYWKKTAIFVVEDDAQNGFDHVDAHRSLCFVISPHVRRSFVDHRFYNTNSVLRTMELLLGLPPMGQLDATAPPLDVFSEQPDNAEAYAAILPAREIVAEVNSAGAYRARDSQRLNFAREDAVPDAVLNDILWHAVKGRRTTKPAIRYGLRLSADRDDD